MIVRRSTEEWAAAVTDGWVDLAELTMIDPQDRPDCGAAGCRALTSWVDPSGVGWCPRHIDAGLHGAPHRTRDEVDQ